MRRSVRSSCVALIVVAFGSVAGAAPAPAPAPVPPPPSAGSSIGALAKEHNLDLGNGSMGVRIAAPTDLVGLSGQTVAMVLWFYDAAGQPIRSAVDGWGDATNHLRVVSRDVNPTAARQSTNFVFQVPYCGFPRRPGGRYSVEARAVLVQRVAGGRVVLARGSTTFFVE